MIDYSKLIPILTGLCVRLSFNKDEEQIIIEHNYYYKLLQKILIFGLSEEHLLRELPKWIIDIVTDKKTIEIYNNLE